jgi:type VI protein secretion system component VasK
MAIDKVAGAVAPEDPVRKWIVVILTIIFIGFYICAIADIWKGDTPATNKIITLLQPIVYVIIGYYFGRVPAEKAEKQLKDEAKEKGKQADEATKKAEGAEAKLDALDAMLSAASGAGGSAQKDGFVTNLSRSGAGDIERMKVTIAQALNVINSSR